MKWIPVSEKMPEDGQRVLIAWKHCREYPITKEIEGNFWRALRRYPGWKYCRVYTEVIDGNFWRAFGEKENKELGCIWADNEGYILEESDANVTHWMPFPDPPESK